MSSEEQESRILAEEANLSQKRLQLYLAEYNEHVHNIRDRVQIEQSILNYSVVLMAALIPASIQIVDHRAFVAFFFVPVVFAAMAVLAFRQDMMITTIARYIHSRLCPRLRTLITDDKAFRLEEALLQMRTSWAYVPIEVARYALFGIPSITSLVVVPYFKRKFLYLWMPADSMFAIADVLLLVVTAVWIGWASSKSYLGVTSQ